MSAWLVDLADKLAAGARTKVVEEQKRIDEIITLKRAESQAGPQAGK